MTEPVEVDLLVRGGLTITIDSDRRVLPHGFVAVTNGSIVAVGDDAACPYTARETIDASRFVVECEHSEFGPVQLDGLMHERRMDLIVRTHEPLPADMERDILVLFGESCTGLNLAGQLFFQAVPVFPVNPLDDFGGRGVQVSA